MEQGYYVLCNDINELLSMIKYGEPGLPYVIDWAVPNLKKQKIFPVYVHAGLLEELGIILSDIRESKPSCEYDTIITYNEFLQSKTSQTKQVNATQSIKGGTNMKRYRICYDKMLVAKGDLNINGELYGGVAAYLEYQVFNKSTGEEIFFTFDDTDTPREEKIEGHYLNDFYDLAYDKENGFIIIPADELKELKDHVIKFRVGMFTKSIDNNGCLEDVSITEEQFVKILKDNPQSFDTADNNFAQNCGVTFNIIG